MLTQQAVSVDTIRATLAGLEADSKAAILARIGCKLLDTTTMVDAVKPEALEAIIMLKSHGIRVALLNGDNQCTTQTIGRQVGIERIIAEAAPEDKIKVIQDLQRDGGAVTMVGSGINDAPTFAVVDIGVTVGSDLDVVKETSGIILVRSDVCSVAASIELPHVTMRETR